jgi:ribosomal protein L11 methyltransferase
MDYICLDISVADATALELLQADLESLPVETVDFPDGEEGIRARAYIPESAYRTVALADFPLAASLGPVSWTESRMVHQNWNAVWEASFAPIAVGKDLYIRAPFHPKPAAGEYQHEIVMEPKMAFGTGHHATTYLMCEALLSMEIQGKRVMDMGCGTAVLAVLAAQRGASFSGGIDIDEHALANAREIASNNGFPEMPLETGDATLLPQLDWVQPGFDLWIANIQRNVLLDDLEAYTGYVVPGGHLLLSGFYEEDVPVLREKAEQLGLVFEGTSVKDRWCRMDLHKPVGA